MGARPRKRNRRDEVPKPYKLDVRKLLKRCDPFSAWGTDLFERDVLEALEEGRFESRPYSNAVPGPYPNTKLKQVSTFDFDHVARIAYLVRYGWEDPIEIDVGVPVLGYDGPAHMVQDGNHRLAAAAVRGDKWILVDAQGQVSEIEKLLWRENE